MDGNGHSWRCWSWIGKSRAQAKCVGWFIKRNNMFNLDQAVLEWRRQMLAAGIKTPVPLEELEIHLREDIERQLNSGANEQQALEIAAQRIGKAKMIKDEFGKNRSTIEVRDWKLKQRLSAGGLLATTLVVAFMVLASRFGALDDNLDSAQQMSVLTALAVMIALVAGGQLGYRLFPVISSQRVRDAIGGSAGVVVATFWIYWFNVVLPRHDYTVMQVGVAAFWAMLLPAGILLGLISGFETAARKKLHQS